VAVCTSAVTCARCGARPARIASCSSRRAPTCHAGNPRSVNEVDRILVSACNSRRARHHHLEHLMQDAVRTRRSGIAAASRAHTPTLRSAARRSSRPPSEDWAPPLKSTVSFLRQTAGRSKGSGVPSVAAVALGWDAPRIRLDNESRFLPRPWNRDFAAGHFL
jgi:hypothetical protein